MRLGVVLELCADSPSTRDRASNNCDTFSLVRHLGAIYSAVDVY